MGNLAYAPRPDNHVRRWSQERLAALLDGLPVGTSFDLGHVGVSVYGGTWTKQENGQWSQSNAAAPLIHNCDASHLGFVVDWRRVKEALAA